MTDRRKMMFLAELARHGILVRAARAASPRASSQYGAVQTFKDERTRDEEFAAQWDEAMQAAEASVEAEIFRRAQEGWEEPIFGGRHREKIVGTVRKYSDRLLELRAKALLPVYRETTSVAVRGRVTHDLDVGVLGDLPDGTRRGALGGCVPKRTRIGGREAADDEGAIAYLQLHAAGDGLSDRPRDYRNRREVYDEIVPTVMWLCQ
ncbi:hypothetical protein [Parasphingorhabdus sp.]|uniref:hypothetical protein n=1 Tax=Parasphingorhabdus sp. TaxID=2709688 RepID=UPI00300202DC